MPAQLPLANGGFAQVDEEDLPALSPYRWWSQWRYYQGRRAGCQAIVGLVEGRKVLLHRHLVQPTAGQQVDHADGDPANNCRSNLRPCTTAQNTCNRGKPRSNTSGFKGVYLEKSSKQRERCWRAQIRVGGKKHSLGRHKTEDAAASAYRAAALKYHGEFARLS